MAAWPAGVDQAVADLFQLRVPQARTLIANVYARHRIELEESSAAALKATVANARQDQNSGAQFRLRIESRGVADALNRRLLRLGGRGQLQLERGTQTSYTIDAESLAALVKDLGAKAPKGL